MNNHPNPADRDRAILWARNMLARPFVVIDTETTGLLRDKRTKQVTHAEICQIGILGSDGTVIMDQLIKPIRPITEESTTIHGITNAMVKDAPMFADAWRSIKQCITGQLVTVYNLDYDRGLLGRCVADMTGDTADAVNALCAVRWQCAMLQYSAFVGEVGLYGDDYRWQKLPNHADDAHSAISDCKATLEVIHTMANSVTSTEEQP